MVATGKEKRRGVVGVTDGMIADWAKAIHSDLTSRKPARPRVRPTGEVVIWLVGRGIDPGALQRVRLWRRAGLDARCLIVDARQSPETGQWIVQVQREEFPERDKALDCIASHQESIEDDDWVKRLELRFYESRAASSTDLAGGGLPLGPSTQAAMCGTGGRERPLYP